MHKPDFKNLENVLFCRERTHVSLIKLHIDEGFKEKYFSRKLSGIEDEIKFSLDHCLILYWPQRVFMPAAQAIQ